MQTPVPSLYFSFPPFNPPVPIHAAAPTQAPELALCFTRQLAPVVTEEGATSSVVELSYHHIDHDRNPLPHGKHRVAVSAYFGDGRGTAALPITPAPPWSAPPPSPNPAA